MYNFDNTANVPVSSVKPMLAASLSVNDLGKLRYPLLASYKIDGIRCLMLSGKAYSRSLKPIRNPHVQDLAYLLRNCYGVDYLDGELVCGNFQETTSNIMSSSGNADFKYLVFDRMTLTDYKTRFLNYFDLLDSLPPKVELVKQHIIKTPDELLEFELQALHGGYEGVMIRTNLGLYKNGRSTVKEGKLLKLKPFEYSEAEIIDWDTLKVNNNEAYISELGYTVRGASMTGLVEDRTRMGTLRVRDLKSGKVFNVGSGFDTSFRMAVAKCPSDYIGKIITYKYQNYGIKDLPRCPVFVGIRDKEDL